MEKIQNIYDKEQFFSDYTQMREQKSNANELIEIPTIKRMLPDLNGKTVLDLGCGAGGMSRYFVECGAKEVVALDISSNMINLAKKLNKNDNISFEVMAMEDISKLNKKFDVVFSSLAFHYVEDFEKLIFDISNLLKQGGILLFSQEHPLTTASILSYEEKGYTEANGCRNFIINNYNNNGKRIFKFYNDNVVKFHRNFECIIGTLLKHNLQIVALEESKADARAIELVPKYVYQKDRPYFLFIKVLKSI